MTRTPTARIAHRRRLKRLGKAGCEAVSFNAGIGSARYSGPWVDHSVDGPEKGVPRQWLGDDLRGPKGLRRSTRTRQAATKLSRERDQRNPRVGGLDFLQ